jgi:predicted DsbA family dithiol-disulfide isomerase
MQIEIFSDVVCPWCAVGKRRFDRALTQFEHADDVNVVWRSFELDPSAPRSSEGDLVTHLAEKYGMSRTQAMASQEKLTAVAAEEGLEFHFDRAQRSNSFDAHRLMHFASELGLQNALKERLFRSYFTDGELIADEDTLVRCASDVGMGADKSRQVLDSGAFANEVREDEELARDLGISGVPFFVIDRKYGLSGAQSTDAILSVLNEAWSKSRASLVEVGENASNCDDGSCAL